MVGGNIVLKQGGSAVVREALAELHDGNNVGHFGDGVADSPQRALLGFCGLASFRVRRQRTCGELLILELQPSGDGRLFVRVRFSSHMGQIGFLLFVIISPERHGHITD